MEAGNTKTSNYNHPSQVGLMAIISAQISCWLQKSNLPLSATSLPVMGDFHLHTKETKDADSKSTKA
jgi:hypothetical protein